MAKEKSRPKRWAEAAGNAREAYDALTNAIDEHKEKLADALSELLSLQEEYEEWGDTMPENLQGGATAEKIQAIQELDFDIEVEAENLEEIERSIDEAEGVELPLGFGRD